MATVKVLIPLSDYGSDPTEAAVPYIAFKKAGFEVYFATENGKTPESDKKLLVGITQKLLGASKSSIEAHNQMSASPEWLHPLSWSALDFTFDPYNLVFLPGGHDKGVRQLLDSPIIHKHLAEYFPKTLKPSTKTVAAICHGVMVLSETKNKEGKSVIHECVTTALPGRFEQLAFWGTRLFMGDYYKTYGPGSDDVEDFVRRELDDPAKQFKSSLSPGATFVVEDTKYNYLSARFPPDSQALAERAVALVQSTLS